MRIMFSPNTQQQAQQQQQQHNDGCWVTPHEHDVLLGRSMFAFKHAGNRRFRIMCAEKLREYMEEPKRTGKTRVAQSILAEIESKGGRFLLDKNNNNNNSRLWSVAPYKKARDKVGHTLRDACIAVKKHNGCIDTVMRDMIATAVAAGDKQPISPASSKASAQTNEIMSDDDDTTMMTPKTTNDTVEPMDHDDVSPWTQESHEMMAYMVEPTPIRSHDWNILRRGQVPTNNRAAGEPSSWDNTESLSDPGELQKLWLAFASQPACDDSDDLEAERRYLQHFEEDKPCRDHEPLEWKMASDFDYSGLLCGSLSSSPSGDMMVLDDVVDVDDASLPESCFDFALG